MLTPLDGNAMDAVFRLARSYNGFTDKPVTEAQLRQVYDLMKWGPTSANQQPARIVWCRTPEAKTRLARCASDQNVQKILDAPVTAIVGMDLDFPTKLPTLFPHTDAQAWFSGKEDLVRESAFRNSTLQGAYLIVAARMIGLDTGPMSGFDAEAVNDAFFAGSPVRVNFISTLGYGDSGSLFPRLPRLEFEEATVSA